MQFNGAELRSDEVFGSAKPFIFYNSIVIGKL